MPTSEKPYLNFIIEPELLKRLDDYRFKHRFATRAAAVKWLLDWSLTQKPVPAEPQMKGTARHGRGVKE